MNILVTGANGQLGRELRRAAETADDEFIFSDITAHDSEETLLLDITELDDIRRVVRDHDIQLIINCAAYTNVDKAESDAEMADRLNHQAVANLAAAMKEVDGWLFHISTDYVFGGSTHNTPIGEDVAPAPTGVYGLTKLRGEEAILSNGCHHLIFRTAWLYSSHGKNFVKTMAHLTAERDELRVVCDQVGTPTFAGDLAEAIADIVADRRYEGNEGIYHYSNEGVCSWYDFAQYIARVAGHSCLIRPCRSAEYPSPVRRPSYSVLDKTKFKQTFGLEVPYWAWSLERMFAETANFE